MSRPWTPGPWKVEQYSDWITVQADEDTTVAQTRGTGQFGYSNPDAVVDAELIALAPAMAEAILTCKPDQEELIIRMRSKLEAIGASDD